LREKNLRARIGHPQKNDAAFNRQHLAADAFSTPAAVSLPRSKEKASVNSAATTSAGCFNARPANWPAFLRDPAQPDL
jgi:hypothetical protein